jgi:TPR repeat protein
MRPERFAAAVVLAILALPARAETPAEEAYSRGDFAAAIALAEPGLAKKDPIALYVTAEMEFYGDGLPKNERAAILKLQEAARQDHAEALSFLGLVEMAGTAVPKDDEAAASYNRRALKAYLKRAKSGDAAAEYIVSTYYGGSPGVKRDDDERIRWMKLAAEAGEVHALEEYAQYLQTGAGPDIDTRAAAGFNELWVEALRAGAEKGNIELMARYGAILIMGVAAPKDVPAGLALLRRSADKDFSLAQTTLGNMYSNGNGVPADEVEAAKWYALSAAQGDPEACLALGLSYKEGRGVEVDPVRAKEWYVKSANQQYTPAMLQLAAMAGSPGAAEDQSEALAWRTKAAELGDADAMDELAWMYHAGKGTPKDLGAYVGWLEKSAARNGTRALVDLGAAYMNGDGVKRDPARAVDYFSRANALGEPLANTWIGYAFDNGFGVARDTAAATTWYRAAAETDADAAAAMAARAASDGDAAETLRWRVKAAELGDLDSRQALCRAFFQGEGVAQDDTAAAGWCQESADGGDPSGEHMMGILYRDGRGVTRNYGEALKLFQAAAKRGHVDVFSDLGGLYENGLGVEKDALAAYRYYREGAGLGDPSSQEALRALKSKLSLGELKDASEQP